MKGANKLFIFTGVALALVAVLIGITMSSGGNTADGQVDDESAKVNVVKAAVDLEPHTLLSLSDIVIEEIAADKAPAGVASDAAQVIGQSYTLGAVKGDYLFAANLQPPGITNLIEVGKRAISVEVDSQGMMSGLIMDGDYVDLVFDARVDIKRVLEIQGLEVEEDGPYTVTFDKDEDNQDESNGNSSDDEDSNEDDDQIIPGTEAADYQGKDGTEFTVLDAGQHLEPVTKMLVQDVKVLRVIQPDISYDQQGQQVQQPVEGGSASEDMGQLILEVTPQQAEAISFMQDENHNLEVVVRGQDDHEVANTTGITFQILMTNETWSMPWPEPIVAPEGTGPEE